MSGRDQAARVLRSEPENGEAVAAAGTPPHPATPHGAPSQAEALRSLLEDPSTLKLADPPEPEAESEPVAPAARPGAAAKPPSKKKFVLIGVGIAALAALGYFGTQYMLVGRFMVGTTTPMSAPTTPRSAPACPATSPRSCPATIPR